MPTVPSNEQFVGISASEDLIERGSAQTNSARTIYTYADLKLGSQSAIAKTGVVVSFTESEIYNTSASAGTGNITNDLTSAQLGIVQKLYHQEGSAPTVPAGWVLMGSGTYSTSALNVIYAEWCGGTRVEYWIVQPA
tara:strand:+ start:731 stop:1141 length:411 start_codon:yes stop_codon:yes gene_type:complete